MAFEPIPFRIRVAVLSLSRPGLRWPDLAPEEVGGRIVEAVHQQIVRLLDPESKRRFDEAESTRLAYRLFGVPGDLPVEAALAAIQATPELGLGSGPDRGTVVRTARERLVDDCDAVIILTPAEFSEDELWPAVDDEPDEALQHARRLQRPIVALPLSSGGARVRSGVGIDARSIARLDLYNGWDVSEDDAREYAKNMEDEVFGGNPDSAPGEGEPAPVTSANLSVVRDHIIPHYVRASLISKHFQDIYLRTARRVYVLAVAAVAFVGVGALVHSLAAPAFAAELVALITILILIRRAHRTHAHEKWLEARFLAERLRHAIHVAACGISPGRHRIPPHVGGKEPPDLWMALAFEEIQGRLPELSPCDERTCGPCSDFVRSAWVGGQLTYHRSKVDEYGRKNRFLERAGLTMFGAAILMAVAHLVTLAAHALHLEWPEPPWFEGALTWLAIVLPAAGASIGGFRAHREYSRLARRSAAMVAALEDVDARLERVSRPEDLNTMLREIETWMVEEAEGWLILLEPLELEAV